MAIKDWILDVIFWNFPQTCCWVYVRDIIKGLVHSNNNLLTSLSDLHVVKDFGSSLKHICPHYKMILGAHSVDMFSFNRHSWDSLRATSEPAWHRQKPKPNIWRDSENQVLCCVVVCCVVTSEPHHPGCLQTPSLLAPSCVYLLLSKSACSRLTSQYVRVDFIVIFVKLD